MACELWCTVEDLCCDKTAYTEAQIEKAIQDATDELARLSYYRYGICDYIVQPCRTGCSAPCWDANCSGWAITPQITPGIPIVEIDEIASYDADKVKTVLDKEDVWTENQVIHFPSDYVFPDQTAGPIGGRNTWNISFSAGNPVPGAGRRAAIALALYWLKADACEDDSCKVPPNIRSISKQGSEWNFLPIDQAIMTIPSVAYFVENYCQVARWSGVISPQNYRRQMVE